MKFDGLNQTLKRLAAVEQEGDRAVIDQFDLHRSSKDPGGDLQAGGSQDVGHAQVEPFGVSRLGRRREAWPPAGPTIGEQSELARHQHTSSNFRDALIHFSGVILEGPKLGDLVGHPGRVVVVVLAGDSQQGEPTETDPADDRSIDFN